MTNNICHLTSAHSRYDTRIFLKMCISLANNGYATSLIVADGLGHEVRDKVKIYDVGAKTGGRLSRMTKTVDRVFQKALDLNADIYHFHDPELIPIGIKLKKRNKKVIFDIHENTHLQILIKDWIPFVIRKPLSIAFLLYENSACKKFDLLIVPQLAMLKKYSKLSKCLLIGNFPHKADILTSSESVYKDRYSLFYAGQLSEQRGIFNMLDLITELKKVNTQYKLTFAGQISEKLLQTAQRHIGWKHTNYLGVLSKKDLYNEYKKHTFGLILLNNVGQYYMAYSLKLFEYMQHSIVVIMPNFGDWVNFNNKHNIGINVTVNDSASISKNIQLISTADLNNYSNNGTKYIKKTFNWETQEKILLSEYERLLLDA